MYHIYLIVFTNEKMTEHLLKTESYFDEDSLLYGEEAYYDFIKSMSKIEQLRSRVFLANFNCVIYVGNESIEKLKQDIFPEAGIISKVEPHNLKIILTNKTKKYYEYIINCYNHYNKITFTPVLQSFDPITENPLLYNTEYLDQKRCDFIVDYNSAYCASYECVVKIILHLIYLGHSKEKLSTILFILSHPLKKLGKSTFELGASQTYKDNSGQIFNITYSDAGLSLDIGGWTWGDKVGYDTHSYNNLYPGEYQDEYDETSNTIIRISSCEADNVSEFLLNFLNCDEFYYTFHIEDLNSEDLTSDV